jgi:predicted nucleic acid-binding Zn ribbon protein
MERAGNFLGRVVRSLERPEAALAWLTAAWPGVVGKALAARTHPIRCERGRLEIAAENKAWQQQFEEMKREFCARINQSWGGPLVREVQFVAAKPCPKHVSHELNNEHTPFIRRRKP